MNHAEHLMRLAIQAAQDGIRQGQSPFGCAISIDGDLIAISHNRVVASTDSTAHAEIVGIRQACQKRKSIFLSGAVVAATCEPCPMCMAALHWARVDTVYFGATITDAQSAGFNELTLPAAELLQRGGSSIELRGGLLVDPCRDLFREWLESPGRTSY